MRTSTIVVTQILLQMSSLFIKSCSYFQKIALELSTNLVCHILDVIYKVEFQFETGLQGILLFQICTFTIFGSWLYWSLMDLQIHVFWNLEVNGVAFTSVMIIFVCFFLDFSCNFWYTRKKNMSIKSKHFTGILDVVKNFSFRIFK